MILAGNSAAAGHLMAAELTDEVNRLLIAFLLHRRSEMNNMHAAFACAGRIAWIC